MTDAAASKQGPPWTQHLPPQQVHDIDQNVARGDQMLEEVLGNYRAAAQHIGTAGALKALVAQLHVIPINCLGNLIDLAAVAIYRLADQPQSPDQQG